MDSLTKCRQFAVDHKLIFEDKGEIGFMRPCCGFISGPGYVDINPNRFDTYDPVWPYDTDLYPPSELVRNRYHKHDCMAVLVHDDNYAAAIDELAAWVDHLNSKGEVAVETYQNGAKGPQVLFSGVIGHALRFTSKTPVIAPVGPAIPRTRRTL